MKSASFNYQNEEIFMEYIDSISPFNSPKYGKGYQLDLTDDGMEFYGCAYLDVFESKLDAQGKLFILEFIDPT